MPAAELQVCFLPLPTRLHATVQAREVDWGFPHPY